MREIELRQRSFLERRPRMTSMCAKSFGREQMVQVAPAIVATINWRLPDSCPMQQAKLVRRLTFLYLRSAWIHVQERSDRVSGCDLRHRVTLFEQQDERFTERDRGQNPAAPCKRPLGRGIGLVATWRQLPDRPQPPNSPKTRKVSSVIRGHTDIAVGVDCSTVGHADSGAVASFAPAPVWQWTRVF